jgi:uncharacterized protein
MRLHLTRAACLVAFAFAAGGANAASFNCSAAATPTEHAICDNPQISKLDEQTSGMYYQIISSGAPARTVSQVKSSQASFIQTRNACGAGYNCLISAYTDQIMYLKNVKSNLGI